MRTIANLYRLLTCLTMLFVAAYTAPDAKADFGFGSTRITINSGYTVNDVKQNIPVTFEFSDPYITVTYNGKTYKYEVVQLSKVDHLNLILFYFSEDKDKYISLTQYGEDEFVIICSPLNLSALSRDTNVVYLLKQLKQRILALKWEKTTPKVQYNGLYAGVISDGNTLFSGYYNLRNVKGKQITFKLNLFYDDFNFLETVETIITPNSDDYKIHIIHRFKDIPQRMPNGFHNMIYSGEFYIDGKPLLTEGETTSNLILRNALVDGYRFDVVRGQNMIRTWDFDAANSRENYWIHKVF